MGRVAGKKFKGFTLIELIVVIAIMGVLAAALSGVYRGYVRNATNETNNDRAHLAYTGFQNMVIQCEVKQDDTVFNAANLGALDNPGWGTTDVRTKKAVVTFEVSGGQLTKIVINAAGVGTSSSWQTDLPMSETYNSNAYKKVSTAIKGEVSTMDDGTYRIYADMENYEVMCAVYTEKIGMSNTEADNEFHDTNYFTSKKTTSGLEYYIMSSSTKQRDAYDNAKHYGCYPMLTAVS